MIFSKEENLTAISLFSKFHRAPFIQKYQKKVWFGFTLRSFSIKHVKY